jgi:hypothetical protein
MKASRAVDSTQTLVVMFVLHVHDEEDTALGRERAHET